MPGESDGPATKGKVDRKHGSKWGPPPPDSSALDFWLMVDEYLGVIFDDKIIDSGGRKYGLLPEFSRVSSVIPKVYQHPRR